MTRAGGPPRFVRARGFTLASGPACLLALALAAVALSPAACSRRPAGSGPLDAKGRPEPTEPVANADSLRRALLPNDLPPALSGSGTTRFYLGDERLPGMTLRFTAQDSAETTAMLRPGMLTPVVSLWAAGAAWALHFPRQRTYILEEGDGAGAQYGPLLSRLAWYLAAPQALLADLEPVRAFRRGAHWIFSGRPVAVQGELPGAEVWVDRESGGILRWSLRDRDGQLQAQVEYSPPRLTLATKGGERGRLDISIPAFEFRGGVILQRVSEKPSKTLDAPGRPADWQRLGANQLPSLLGDLARDLSSERQESN